jgi:hypothetical protein
VTRNQVLARLQRIRSAIKTCEHRRGALQAQWVETLQAGREVDPTTGKATVIYEDMARASGVSEQAIFKTLARARNPQKKLNSG